MTDLTDFLATPPTRLVPCKFGEWLGSLSEDEQVSVKKAVLNPEWSLAALATGLKDYGLPIGEEAIRKHRTGACRTCGPI
jgi:hypothetical protein